MLSDPVLLRSVTSTMAGYGLIYFLVPIMTSRREINIVFHILDDNQQVLIVKFSIDFIDEDESFDSLMSRLKLKVESRDCVYRTYTDSNWRPFALEDYPFRRLDFQSLGSASQYRQGDHELATAVNGVCIAFWCLANGYQRATLNFVNRDTTNGAYPDVVHGYDWLIKGRLLYDVNHRSVAYSLGASFNTVGIVHHYTQINTVETVPDPIVEDEYVDRVIVSEEVVEVEDPQIVLVGYQHL